jgi:hypothetical protein
MYIKRESSDGAADGELRGYVDGVEMSGSLTNVENFNVFPTIDEVRLGSIWGQDATPSGSMYLDDLVVRDTGGLIGPVGGGGDLSISIVDSAAYKVPSVKIR